MLWCNLNIADGQDQLGRNRLGRQLGLVTQSANGELPASDIATARHLAARLANVATQIASL